MGLCTALGLVVRPPHSVCRGVGPLPWRLVQMLVMLNAGALVWWGIAFGDLYVLLGVFGLFCLFCLCGGLCPSGGWIVFPTALRSLLGVPCRLAFSHSFSSCGDGAAVWKIVVSWRSGVSCPFCLCATGGGSVAVFWVRSSVSPLVVGLALGTVLVLGTVLPLWKLVDPHCLQHLSDRAAVLVVFGTLFLATSRLGPIFLGPTQRGQVVGGCSWLVLCPTCIRVLPFQRRLG